MPFDAHANFAVSAVATAPIPATSGTSLVVTGGHGARFPVAPFNATVHPAGVTPDPANAEVVRVTARTADTLTIARAQEGSSARTIVVGDRIYAAVTAKALTDVEAIEVALVTLAPATSARNTIQTTGAAVVPLIVKGAAAQSVNLQEWKDSAGTTLANVDEVGSVYCGNISGQGSTGPYFDFLVDQQTLTALAIDVSQVSFTARGLTGHTGNLQEWRTADTIVAAMTPAGKLQLDSDIEVDGALDHDGTTVGFYGVAPAARPAAYTQTYTTATRVHAQTAANTAHSFATLFDTGEIQSACDALGTRINELKNLVNQLIDDGQSVGLLQ